MTQRELLFFIRQKFASEGELTVLSTGESLKECLAYCGIADPTKVSTEHLHVAASAKMFHRFDHFNDAYNPFG